MSAIGIANKLADGVAIIPGMEITCERGVHLIGLFLQEEVVSREIDEVIGEIHSQGGLALLPHPFRPITGLLYERYKTGGITGEEAGRVLSEIDLIEGVNFRCPSEAMLETDKYLQSYPNIPQTASSDAHNVSEVGKAYLELEDFRANTLEELKKALLQLPCLLRFEVYNPEIGIETRKIIIPKLGRRLIWKAKRLLRFPSQVSAGKIFGRDAKKQEEVLEQAADEELL